MPASTWGDDEYTPAIRTDGTDMVAEKGLRLPLGTLFAQAPRSSGVPHIEIGGGVAGNAGTIRFMRGSDISQGAAVGFEASANEVDEFRFAAFGSTASWMSWHLRNASLTREVMRLHTSGGLSLGTGSDPGAGAIRITGGIGFFGVAAPGARPSVTGSRGANAALASLLTALNACGIITDSTTA